MLGQCTFYDNAIWSTTFKDDEGVGRASSKSLFSFLLLYTILIIIIFCFFLVLDDKSGQTLLRLRRINLDSLTVVCSIILLLVSLRGSKQN